MCMLQEEEVAYNERLKYARYVEFLSDVIWFSDDACTHKLVGLLREVIKKLKSHEDSFYIMVDSEGKPQHRG